MAKDDPSNPTWQQAVSQQSSSPQILPKPVVDAVPELRFTEVEEMPPIPTRNEAKAFLAHPGTKDATPFDRIRFLELKNVQRKDIEALIPEAKKYYAKVSPTCRSLPLSLPDSRRMCRRERLSARVRKPAKMCHLLLPIRNISSKVVEPLHWSLQVSL